LSVVLVDEGKMFGGGGNYVEPSTFLVCASRSKYNFHKIRATKATYKW